MKAVTAYFSLDDGIADLETEDIQAQRVDSHAWRAVGVASRDGLAQATEQLVKWGAVDSADQVKWERGTPGRWTALLDEE